MLLCLGTSIEFFVILVVLHFVVVLHLSMFFIRICFWTSSLTLPRTVAGFLHPFYTFRPAHRRVIHGTFIFNHSVIFLPRALRFWVGIFYPQAFFTLRSFTDILPARSKASLGASSSSLKLAGVQTDPRKHRPDLSVCLIHNNPYSSYSERFIFKFYQTLSWITCGEILIYLLLSRF